MTRSKVNEKPQTTLFCDGFQMTIEDKNENRYQVRENRVVVEGKITTQAQIEALFPEFYSILHIKPE